MTCPKKKRSSKEFFGMDEEEKKDIMGWLYDFGEEEGEEGEDGGSVEKIPELTREEQEVQVKQTLLELYSGIGLCAVFLLLAGNLILGGNLGFTVGALAGIATAAGLAGYMYHSVLVAAEYPEKQASGYMKRTSLLRMVIMIAVIGAAVYFFQFYGLFGAILGILTLKLSALCWPVIHKYSPWKREK